MGHGGGAAVLVRNYERTGPMGDTWLDNIYANFRIPPSPRMRRLLSDRGSFWIGGAYCGTELPWESIGYFGWEPTATPNSLRYDWGLREFGKDKALFCTDPLAGLITAGALVRQDKSLAGLNTDSLKKRFKEKRFAAGASRENIASCDRIGLSLDEFLTLGLEAMKGIAPELGL